MCIPSTQGSFSANTSVHTSNTIVFQCTNFATCEYARKLSQPSAPSSPASVPKGSFAPTPHYMCMHRVGSKASITVVTPPSMFVVIAPGSRLTWPPLNTKTQILLSQEAQRHAVHHSIQQQLVNDSWSKSSSPLNRSIHDLESN